MMKKITLAVIIIFVAGMRLYAQNSGVGTTAPASKLNVNGNVAVGSGYTTTAAPADGAIIEGNVGIGTATPTNRLDVVAATDPLKLTGLQSSTSANDKGLVVDANGIIKTGLNDDSNFVGNLTTNVSVASSGTAIAKIAVQNELVDKGNEYDPATGLFLPLKSGTYAFEIEITFSAPTAPSTYGVSGSGRCIVGFVNNTTKEWVSRFNFSPTLIATAFFAKGVANLTAGQSYFFGINPGSSNGTGTITAISTGSTGSGTGTYFSVQRIQ